MRKKHVKHRVAVAVTQNAPLFELAVPCEVFGAPRPDLIDPPYELLLCAADPEVRTASGLAVPNAHPMAELAAADTVIVPACADITEPTNPALITALQSAHQHGSRIVGLCSGAFALAQAGILDGKPATTHWMYADALATKYPDVHVDPAVLYTADDNVYTSAGTAAAIDLCLELIRRDRGTEVVNELARRLVTAPHRTAGQAQFVPTPIPPEPSLSLGPLVDWVRKNLDQRLTLADLAAQAAMSPRTLIRRFASEYAMTPSHWLAQERLRRAQHLLETTDLTIDLVANRAGYGTTASMRTAFSTHLHTPPATYRDTFRSTP